MVTAVGPRDPRLVRMESVSVAEIDDTTLYPIGRVALGAVPGLKPDLPPRNRRIEW